MSFTKATILQDILSKSNIRAIIDVTPYGGEPSITCPFGKDGAGSLLPDIHTERPYTVAVMDTQGDYCERRNIQIVVYDEGLSGEQAYYSQQTTPSTVLPVPDNVITAIKSYVIGLGVKSYRILSYDAEQQYAIVDSWIDSATTCSLKHYRLFMSAGSITHREII